MRNSLGEYQKILLLGGRSDIGAAIAAGLTSTFTSRVILAGRSMNEGDVAKFCELLSPSVISNVRIDCVEFDAAAVGKHQEFARGFESDPPDLVIIAFGELGDNEAMRGDPLSAGRLITVNMVGAVTVALAFSRILEEQGNGHLLFLSSVAGVRARRSNFIYGSSKAGLDAFAQGMSDALAKSGVDVTIVRPGFVRTRMTEGLEPAPFSTTVDQVASSVVEGVRRGRKVIWTPGVLRYVFAVLRLLPTSIWRRLPDK